MNYIGRDIAHHSLNPLAHDSVHCHCESCERKNKSPLRRFIGNMVGLFILIVVSAFMAYLLVSWSVGAGFNRIN